MNRNLYRIVFNRAQGLFQVVPEIARRDGPGAGVGGNAAGSRFFATFRPLRFAVALALGQAVIVPLANAQVVADPGAPGNQRPTVLEAPNGAPLVNIQTPSAASVSRNTYSQFDVGPQGAILNNSRTNTQTQLGGWVQGNPWLARGTARVILNEVNSSDPSRLNGYIEVAGDRAQLVIANPAGISCDGCGFINADRATITTGRPVINGGSLEEYRVQGGAIRVNGQGMDASATNYTDLIARSVEANAGIWAQQLRITAGSNDVSADHTKVQKTAARGDVPAFALDVGALGGMYSQKIVLVGTEHGVGVRNAGTIGAQAGQLVVTADGRLENAGSMQAGTDTRIDASGGVANAGTLSAGRELVVNTPEDIDNRRGTLNAGRIEANAGLLKNLDGTIGQTGTQELALHALNVNNRKDGRIGLAADTGASPGSGGNGTGTGTGTGTGSGEGADGTTPGDSNRGGDEPSGSVVASLPRGVLNITTTIDNDGGRIMAGGHIDLTASDGLDNDGGHLGVRHLDVSGGDLSNRGGEIRVAADARIATILLNNDAGLMQLDGPVTLSAQNLSNRAGTFRHSDRSDTHIRIKGQLDNSDGTLASNAGRLTLDAGQLLNTAGQIAHSGDAGLMVNAGTFRGAGGGIATIGSATLQLGYGDHRNATLSARQIDLAAQSFDNRSGRIIATGNETSRLDVTGTLDNSDSGAIASNGDLRINTTTLDNASGSILHAGDGHLNIDAGTLRGRNGSIAGNGELTLKGDATDLDGATTQARQVRIDTGSLSNAGGAITATGDGALNVRARERIDNTSGTIASNDSLDLHTGTLVNQDGRLQAAGSGDSQIVVKGQFDNRRGNVITSGDATLQAGGLNNQGGVIAATEQAALAVDIDGSLDNSTRGLLAADGNLSVSASILDNRQGAIRHAGSGSAKIAAADLQGAGGGIASNGALDISGDHTDLSGGNTSGGRIRISTGRLFNAGGKLIASGDDLLTIRATESVDNTAGTVAGNGALVLRTGSLVNRDGTVQMAGTADTRIDVADFLDNTGGTLVTAGATAIRAGELINQRGRVQAAGDAGLEVDVAGNLDNNESGLMASAGNTDIRAGMLDNRYGTVSAAGLLTANIQQMLDNRNGRFVSAGDLGIRAATLDNRDGGLAVSTDGNLSVDTRGYIGNAGGTLQGAGDVSLASGGLGNAGGTVIGASVAVDTRMALLDNAGGTIASTDGTLGIDSGALNNARGLLQSRQGMRVDTHGQTLINTDAGAAGGILSGGTLALSGGNLNNRGGIVHSQGDLIVRTGDIENAVGQLGSSADADIDATSLGNAGGTVQAGNDLKVLLSGAANNNGGLMVSGNGLTLNAAQIFNRDTQSVNASQPLGLQGDRVVLIAGHTDNTTGTIAADNLISIRGPDAAGLLDNTHGNISSGGGIDVTVSRVHNSQGTLIAGETLDLTADSLGGDGSLLSGGDLSLSLQQDFASLREITASRHAVIRTAGLLTNDGVIRAGDLEVHGADVNNNVSGEMSGVLTKVAAGNTLTNRGLIDGSQTRIDAGTLDNVGSGRLYGDHLAIRAGTVNNREEDGPAAVIAARQRLDIGASLINNREKALIFSAGSGSDALNIGGTLDANHHAAARAGLILNDSATIESLGGLTVDASRLLNRNLHFNTELAKISGPTRLQYIQPEGDAEKHDAGEYRLEHWSHARRLRHRETGAKIRNWTQYDVSQTEYETQVTESAPALIRAGGNMTLRGDELVNDRSRIIAGGVLQGDLDRINNVAAPGEHRIRQSGTSQYTYSKWRGGRRRYHQRKWDSKIAYAPADMVNTIELGVSSVVQNAAAGGSGFAVADRQNHQVDATVGGGVRVTGGIAPGQITEVRAEADRIHGPGAVTGTYVTDNNGPARLPGQEVTTVNGGTPEIIRTVQVGTDVPVNSLFHISPDAGGYLVETDPRFTDYRSWLSSDYMLSQLGYDPATVHKRLGDGFYEQQLVRDQIGQLTGRRFLDGYADDEAQYRALLEAGVTYAKAWGLRPGVALSAAQMAQLTSDIVWLVERDVTLADGSTTRALVPQIYVRVKPGDLDGNGTLLAASAIDLDLKGDLINTGTIAGRAVVRFTGENLRNIGGRITGDAVALNARTDIDNIGGTLDAGSALQLMAGRDLNVTSTTHSDARQAGRSDFSRTSLDRVAGLYVTNPGGILLASAGRDASLTAARIINSGKDGQTAVAAGRDLTLGAVRIAEQENNVRNVSNYLRQGYEQDVGSSISAAGDVRLQAGHDLTALAANVTSEHGALTALAQGDVNLLAGEAHNNWAEGRQHTSRSLLGSGRRTTRDSLEETRAVASTFSGNTVAVRGRNVTVTGSNVVSDAGTVIMAHNNLTLQAATETSRESHFKETRKSGFLYNGGAAFTIGNQMQSGDRRDVSTRAAAATVGSTVGDVTLVAGNHYQQTGSHVLAPQGDIDIHAKKVNIVEARETGRSVEQSKFRQSGLTVALSAPVLSAIETAGQMKRAASQTTDGRMQALAAATTGLAAKNAYDAVQADPKAAGGVNISVTVGATRSDSKSTTTTDTAAGSTVAAGGEVRISAAGDRDSDLTVRGSDISAGGDAILKADGDINLLAARNTVKTDRSNSNSSAGVGVAISVGQGGAAMGVTASASVGKGKGEGRDVTWTNSHVTAGERLTLESGGDTRLRGAVAGGRQVVADVGGNLSIESLQDTSFFKSKDTSAGGSVTVGAGFSGSVNLSQQKIHSDYASVTEQSRIEAGDGGFRIKVRGNTDLRGAAITSSEQAVRDGLNTLTTGTLTTSDISNHAEYSASSVSVGGGYSTGNGDRKESGPGGGVGTNQQGQAATGGQVPGSTLPALSNFSASLPVAMAASGNSTSTTRSGISGASVTITDEPAQQALSGRSVDEMMAELNRDVFTGQDGSNALRPIFNEREIRAGFEIVGALTRETGTLLNNMAKKADVRVSEAKAAEAMADDPGNGLSDAQRQALRDQAAASYAEARDIDANWGAGGTYRQIAAALTAAAGGNVTGTTSQFAQNMLVNYVQQQGAGYIGKLVANGTLTEGSALHAAMHAIVACAGAAASSQSCGSAALGASASSLLTGLFGETTPDEKATEREAKRNLIVSIVTGIGAAGGVDAAPASTAAITAVDNNWLATQQIVQMNKELAAADGMLEYLKIQGKWAYISGKQDVLTTAGIGKGLALAGWDDVQGLAAFLSDPRTGLKGLKDLINDPEVRQQFSDSLYAEFEVKINRMHDALESGGSERALQLGEDLGNLVWQVGTVVTGVGTAAKAGVALAKAGIKVSSRTLDVMKLGAQLLKAEGKGLGGTVSISEIGMQWGKGIERQGKPFEAFVQAKLPPGTDDLNMIKSNFSTFDHLTPDGIAISTKTLDTTAKTYQQPAAITRKLNNYVDDMVKFTRDGVENNIISSSSFTGREMHLAVPASTTSEQFSAIARTIEYAKQFGINVVVTKVR
ncbi:TPA: filamentous hemagglutinin N-terminal domain-containing protein [Salmonella enterica]|uniref:Filamentous hemagglutinin N-terminal domain-containing protein n=1 Tax=Salmonella enterica TaxID=28901 RepID=A0A744CC04_SALER|nr:filamentous hemagglutinin N-terminal domain-containing protein [Salmonella enterica]HAF4920031.1 filamentous hemagglutinin N-terminal domain-containing protein [Salmonella enterica]